MRAKKVTDSDGKAPDGLRVHRRRGRPRFRTSRDWMSQSSEHVPGGTMIIEMRTYQTKPGMRAEFLEIFRSKSIPAHKEIGMKILGPFVSIENPDTFFFMR